jgi:hypothetical protein
MTGEQQGKASQPWSSTQAWSSPCYLTAGLLLVRPFRCLQDNVWAEQAHVFPDWHGYSSLLSQRAAMADRHWLESIGLKDTAADSAPAADRLQHTTRTANMPAVLGRQGEDGSSKAVRRDGAGAGGVLSRTAVWLRRVADRLDAQ